MKKYISSTFEIGQIVMIEEEGSLTNLFLVRTGLQQRGKKKMP